MTLGKLLNPSVSLIVVRTYLHGGSGGSDKDQMQNT